MQTPYPKRLIEADIPIKRISTHARREKSIRHGHISTLHIWWARRPLAACRAVVCASLWPDHGDAICSPRFVETAKRLMTYWGKECLLRCSSESYPRFNMISRTPDCLDDAAELRKALLDFIADFANWDNATDAQYLAVARTLTVAAHDALEGHDSFHLPKSITVDFLNEAIKDAPRPLLVDPFAGGGAIPLEGLRCGADAFASDLNPVAVLLNKVVLEYIPKYGNAEIRMRNAEGQEVVFQGLADAVAYWGNWMKEQAEKELAEFYPKDDDGATPIAYLWARTITCEGPGCGAEVPLMRSFWLAKNGDKSVAVQIVPKPEEKRCDFVIIKKEKGRWVYQDKPERTFEKPTFDGTVPALRTRDRRGETLFIDARKLGQLTDHTHRDLTGDDSARIAGTYHAWRGEEETRNYEDIPGFCKAATLADIEAHGYVLTPGRYVGAEEIEDDGVPFEEKMAELSARLYAQMAEAETLDAAIRKNLERLGYGE